MYWRNIVLRWIRRKNLYWSRYWRNMEEEYAKNIVSEYGGGKGENIVSEYGGGIGEKLASEYGGGRCE